MTFWNYILNSIPIVGHIKSVGHFLLGEKDEAATAFMAATRSAVFSMLAGPGGAAALAVGYGSSTDSVTPIITDKPKGTIANIVNLADDLSTGRNPVISIASATLSVGADAVEWLSGGMDCNVLSNAATVVGKEALLKAQEIVKMAAPICAMAAADTVATALCDTINEAFLEIDELKANEEKRDKEKKQNENTNKNQNENKNQNQNQNKNQNQNQIQNQNQNENNRGDCNQGPDPPKQNPNKRPNNGPTESHWKAFLNFFNVTSLDQVCINGVYIFRNISKKQLKALEKLIITVLRQGILSEVLETLEKLFNYVSECKVLEFEANADTTVVNFISFVEFIMAYVGERARVYNEMNGPSNNSSYSQRRRYIFSLIFEDIFPKLVDIFRQIYLQIKSDPTLMTLNPTFRNIYSAIYHYFKHRRIPKTNEILKVSQYSKLVKELLAKTKERKKSEYEALVKGKGPPVLINEIKIIFFNRFCRTVRIVFKIHEGNLQIASCYILDDHEDDKDLE